jgi:adenine deaminase
VGTAEAVPTRKTIDETGSGLLLLFAVIASFVLASCSRPANAPLAITHVTVIDATGSFPQPDMTVLVAGRLIISLGSSRSTPIPRNAQILEATGKFLIPGLVDAHLHLTGSGEPTGSREFIVPLLLANGITTGQAARPANFLRRALS